MRDAYPTQAKIKKQIKKKSGSLPNKAE